MANAGTVALRLVNETAGFDNYVCVIWQENLAVESQFRKYVAWQVIHERDFDSGRAYAFDYPFQLQVAASDSWNNLTPRIDAEYGTSFSMTRTESGDALVPNGNIPDPTGIEMTNNLEEGSINFWCYRGGKKLALAKDVDPGISARFAFDPAHTIHLGIALLGEIEEGVEFKEFNGMASPVMLGASLPLRGVVSADIVMTGGGGGSVAQRISFIIKNVVTDQ